jgi:histidine ammonia-lyase
MQNADKSTIVELDGHSLTLESMWRTAVEGVPCRLCVRSRDLMRASRALIEQLADGERVIYGINSGFGPLSGCRVEPGDLALHQLNLLAHLSVGQGALFSAEETRAIMVARANALARGYSGIREEVVDLLLEALNYDALPEIPSEGSVGASGDLVPWLTWRDS